MKIKNQEQILDQAFRLKVIQEINGTENVNRKKKAFMRYEIYKDMCKKYIQERLENEGLKKETVAVMMNRASNISICRKVINKLARTYNAGVVRSAQDDALTFLVDEYAKELDLNMQMKKSDRYRELYKNAMIQVIPEQEEYSDKYEFCIRVLSPWQYDVIESNKESEDASVVILSEFVDKNADIGYAEVGRDGYHSSSNISNQTNGVDDKIADSMLDANKGKMQTYIWWSDLYHFTTDEKGEIIASMSPEDKANPIGKLPFENVSEGQDGYFWADGGDDLIDGSILINQLITDMNSIAYIQGYGQFVVTGKNLPSAFTMGPHHAVVLNYDPSREEPKPEVTVVSANPPLDSWMKAIEQYAALLLSTNNLSPGTMSMRLDASNFPSGIAMLIEQSEATSDIEDTQKNYIDIEESLFDTLFKWHNFYHGKQLLVPELMSIGAIPEVELNIKFQNPKASISEKENLDVIKQRKELNLNTQEELLQKDDPSLTLEQAKAKVLEIKSQASELLKSKMSQGMQTSPQVGAPTDGQAG